jgi:cell fate regulator YaaT (PSP1 superfamily)
MRVVEVQFVSWDRTYLFDPKDLSLESGDQVIVRTDLTNELGEVILASDIDEKKIKEFRKGGVIEPSGATDEEKDASSELQPVIRKATMEDIEKIPTMKTKKEALDYVIERKESLKLPMKFFDVHFSFDGSRITFAFIADGRVDFRELVKDITRHFGRTIRLQQIGIRDEAKIMGDVGHCGRQLCCRKHLVNLSSITSEMAEMQQCSHRGSERISGVCGRLMCCLGYEQNGYEELNTKMPAIGAKVNVDGKRGTIISHHILKQSVNVEFKGENGESRTVVEVDLNRNKENK